MSLYFNLEKAGMDTIACRELGEWSVERTSVQPSRCDIFGGVDANTRVSSDPDLCHEDDVVGPMGYSWNSPSRHTDIIVSMLSDMGCYLSSTWRDCGNYATYYWYGAVARQTETSCGMSRVDFLFAKNN